MTYKPPCVERHSASVLSPRDKDARARSCGHIRDVMLWRTRTHALSMPSQRHGRPYINFEWKNWDISVLSPLTPNTSRSLNALFTGRSCTRLTGVATRSIFDLGLIVQKLVYTLSWYKTLVKRNHCPIPRSQLYSRVMTDDIIAGRSNLVTWGANCIITQGWPWGVNVMWLAPLVDSGKGW